MSSNADLRQRFAAAGQEHVFKYYDTLSEDEKALFEKQLSSIPVEKLSTFLTAAKSIVATSESDITPFAGSVASVVDDADKTKEWHDVGTKAIHDGTVAALVLAGGQGTRLGFDGPKGCYDIQMPSHKTLFQLLCERLLKLSPTLPLYIMTSPLNHDVTVDFFKQHDNFGINVYFFAQGMLPCLDSDGKILLEGPGTVAMAPDGNGGIYPALDQSGMLAQMKENGIAHLHVFSIDNALCRPADPVFMGYCIANQADVGNKVLWKAEAHEKVGVLAQKGGDKPCIVEYSDISKEMAERVDESTGKLVFGAANICNHYYTLEFLATTVLDNMDAMYHIAHKKIPYYDGTQVVTPTTTPNGMKLESFIFDVFELSQRMAVLEVRREEEFAPVKNATGKDSPDTAREYLSNLAKSFLTKAGATLSDGDGGGVCCEVSPLTSYAGEGLEDYKGKEVKCPFTI